MKGTKKQTVLLGMSGGVDSSVSAVLLQKQGYDVIGGFIKNWSDAKDLWSGECQWRGDRRDAMRVAAKLDIPLLTFDYESIYRKKVVDKMFKAYAKGVTPNPDVLCNQEIKFGVFAAAAKKLNVDLIATGHYARTKNTSDGITHLIRGLDPNKDQSYFLHRVTQEALAMTKFPVGNLRKPEVKKIAKSLGLATAEKKESMGICFIGKQPMKDFLRTRIPSKPGKVVDPSGNVIGVHEGLDSVTIGQRHGFRIRVCRNAGLQECGPWYAAAKDLSTNCLVVVPGKTHPDLYSSEATVSDLHWIANQPTAEQRQLKAVVRYRQEPVPIQMTERGKKLHVVFQKPVFAVSPGQSAVFYQGLECLGGGIIV
ncbi:tRNA 2-thiouridine(34) synthase MnmA [Candidatus Uhrbacteria bacterium]|nr:tRNA 2-thiouridine(34) synthase MnmA [Candidatus Uhrbacteria bacterium]